MGKKKDKKDTSETQHSQKVMQCLIPITKPNLTRKQESFLHNLYNMQKSTSSKSHVETDPPENDDNGMEQSMVTVYQTSIKSLSILSILRMLPERWVDDNLVKFMIDLFNSNYIYLLLS